MELTEQIAAILGVFALLGGMLWFLRRRGLASFPGRRGGAGRRLEVLERVSLTPQHAVHLVRVAGKVLLIGTAPSSCSLLDAPPSKDFSAPETPDLIGSSR